MSRTSLDHLVDLLDLLLVLQLLRDGTDAEADAFLLLLLPTSSFKEIRSRVLLRVPSLHRSDREVVDGPGDCPERLRRQLRLSLHNLIHTKATTNTSATLIRLDDRCLLIPSLRLTGSVPQHHPSLQ